MVMEAESVQAKPPAAAKLATRVSLFKILLVLLIALFAWTNAKLLLRSLAEPYKKDLQQEYLMAKALTNGVNPYAPLPELTQRWLPGHQIKAFTHPTPHPFAIGWLSLPLAALSFPQAAAVWLAFECLCLLAALALWRRIQGQPITPGALLWLFVGLLAWHPLSLELYTGQLSLVLLPLFLVAWLALRAGKDVQGGLWLGGLVVLKMAGAPILLWLAWRRRWRAVAAAATLWTSAHLLAIALHGWPLVRDYYLKVGPEVSALYRVNFANLSLWTLGQRLFGEMNWEFVSVPLWPAPLLVKVLTVLVPLAWLAWLLFAAERAPSFDTSFALLMGGGLFLTPVAWVHYFVMALPALGLLFARLAAQSWPRRRTWLAALALSPLCVSEGLYFNLTKQFFNGVNAQGLPLVGALPALLTLIPLAALTCLLWQLLWLEQRAAAAQSSPDPGAADWRNATFPTAPTSAEAVALAALPELERS